jgi:hypothetical protein
MTDRSMAVKEARKSAQGSSDVVVVDFLKI